MMARGAEPALLALLKTLQPLSPVALLATLVLLFGFQGRQIVDQPLIIAMLAVPILIQVYFNAGVSYWLNRKLGVAHCVAGPSALIGASNFFELAVAAAISLFGFESGANAAFDIGLSHPDHFAGVMPMSRTATAIQNGIDEVKLEPGLQSVESATVTPASIRRRPEG